MSTRSGKRIHSSFHENTQKADVDHVAQSENKSKSRRCKENVEVLNVSSMKTKKRSNYVSYPKDDEVPSDAVDSKAEGAKPTRSLRKNALREQNNIASSTENSDTHIETLKPVRITRRTRKFAEDVESAQENLNQVEEVIIETTKSKKDKKKRKSNPEETVELASKKKSKKKVKKNKRSGSMIVEDIVPQNGEKDNKCNVSTDSFHSAAGSPLKDTRDNDTKNMLSPVLSNHETPAETTMQNGEVEDKPSNRPTRSSNRQSNIEISENLPDNDLKVLRKRKSSIKDSDTIAACTELENEELDATLTNSSKKRKSSIKSITPKKSADKISEVGIKNSTFDLEDLERRKSAIKALINTTYEKSGSPKIGSEYLSDKNTIKDDESTSNSKMLTPQSKLNSTYEKTESESIQLTNVFENENPILNTTFEKDNPVIENVPRISTVINTTYEKEIDSGALNRRKSSLRNATIEKDIISTDDQSESQISSKNKRKSTQAQKQSPELNSTFDKTEKLNTTFEKDKNLNLTLEKDKNLNSTFDKDKNLDLTFDKNSKCSLISTDNSNITLDKSEVSRISITSDDSKDNIMNTTPVLIESSLDESQINTSKRTSKAGVSQSKITSPLEGISLKVPTTPLIREGTFTKETENEPQVVAPRTPTRKMSLPSPGCTPFPSHSVSKHMLNVTRSLEKSRRSSLAEPAPRTTRVMFCSPVNNPVVVEQQRRKVIKSNLKGSNKSFVFEDEGELGRRSTGRKRSYTHSEVEEARAKRTRPGDGAQSLCRPARPRTFSATGKLPDPVTPSKKATPKKPEAKISRTKLPNFAALHKREFAKMESLDQCQERKARRAKQLLTPTGSVTVLERSPKDAEETKQSEQKTSNPDKGDSKDVDKRSKDAKKLETPVKSVPTLRSLNPGYSRFGFKLNYDVNPFNVTKNDGDSSQILSSKKKSVKKDFTRPLKELRGLKRQATLVSLPSVAGATSAKEAAKQTVMREKSFTEKRNKTRDENRTVIKGVRTNRRFELQMRMRNLD